MVENRNNFRLWQKGVLKEFSQSNWQRATSPEGYDMLNKVGANTGDTERDINILNQYLITALLEELGELAGAIKKLARGFNEGEYRRVLYKMANVPDFAHIPRLAQDIAFSDCHLYTIPTSIPDQQDTIYNITHAFWLKGKQLSILSESADLFTYLDLFLSANHINIHESAIHKFNQVSERMNFPERFKIQ